MSEFDQKKINEYTALYYINSNKGFSKEEVAMMKRNFGYVIRALNHLCVSISDAPESPEKFGGGYRDLLMSRKLPYPDRVSGLNTSNLANKLYFLINALNNPNNLKIFKNSFLYRRFLLRLYTGYIVDEKQNWENYKLKENHSKELDEGISAEGAFRAWYKYDDTPIGLNFAAIIDTIVKTDKNGHYYLKDEEDINKQNALVEALKKSLSSFKNTELFKNNYTNELTQNNRYEDEEELF